MYSVAYNSCKNDVDRCKNDVDSVKQSFCRNNRSVNLLYYSRYYATLQSFLQSKMWTFYCPLLYIKRSTRFFICAHVHCHRFLVFWQKRGCLKVSFHLFKLFIVTHKAKHAGTLRPLCRRSLEYLQLPITVQWISPPLWRAHCRY